MLKHYNFIPFHTGELPAGSSLVFAPHPDDETFGLGGSILKLTDNNQIVNVVMMTDGAAGGDAAVRKNELLKATKALGVNEVHFFGAPDGDLQVNSINTKSVLDLIEKYMPENIFFPSPLEYHPDHRSTAWLVWNALQSISFSGNVFSYEIANQSPASMLIDISDVMERKREIMRIYKSQTEQHSYVETITSMNRIRAYTLFKEKASYAEALFKFDTLDLDLMSYYYAHFNQYHKGVSTQKLPLVSIMIRTKNRPEQLKNALESIEKQTYQQFEVNIVNDGGKNIQHVVNSFDFERSFVKNHKTSQGRAAAANALLKMVQGEYCIFLDDDDTFDADHIENLVQIIIQNKNMLACYSGIRVGNNLENVPSYNNPYNAALLRKMNFIPFHAVLFSSKLIEMGCKFDESLLVYEDWDFWLQVAQHTEFYHYNKITATYNINGQSGAGGAGGHTTKGLDLHLWTLKVYEKWQNVWSAKQIHQTFHALSMLNSGKVQDVQKQIQSLKQENNKKLEKRDETINDLQKRIEDQKTNNKHLNHHVDQILKEKIREHDSSDHSKRNFELVSARNYEKQCIELFEEVFEEKMTKEFWNWKYAGVKWRGVCALKDGKIVGHYNGMARSILYFGKHKKAFPAGDTMVSPKTRGGIKENSPFYIMTRGWIKANLGPKKEFLLSFGFPNKRVMALAVHVGLYVEVDTITEVHWNMPDEKIVTDYHIEGYTSSIKINEGIQKAWQAMASDFKDSLIGIRNVPYLKHRYLDHPKFDYKIYLVYAFDKTLKAVFVLKQEGKTMLLMDVISKKENFGIVIKEALKATKKAECTTMKCWITTSKVKLFEYYDSITRKTDISIPTSGITSGFDPVSIKDKWFLMSGDSDFL